MAPITMRIGSTLVGRIRCTALLLFEATAEALHFALGALSRDPEAIDEVRQHFARLSESAALLDQLGWTVGRAAADVEVAAAPDLLHDAVLGSLLDAGESMAVALHDGAGGVEARAREVVALDALLQEVDGYR